jgi:hypothetical protein
MHIYLVDCFIHEVDLKTPPQKDIAKTIRRHALFQPLL